MNLGTLTRGEKKGCVAKLRNLHNVMLQIDIGCEEREKERETERERKR
jgi:hypothetical protein